MSTVIEGTAVCSQRSGAAAGAGDQQTLVLALVKDELVEAPSPLPLWEGEGCRRLRPQIIDDETTPREHPRRCTAPVEHQNEGCPVA
jgi:hypothetical protein